AFTAAVRSDRIPSAPSTPSTSSNDSASASCTRAGTVPVTCTRGGTSARENDLKLLQPRLRRRAGDDEHAHVVRARPEGAVAGEQREAELGARAVRVRDRGDAAVERERDPASAAQLRQVADDRRRDERGVLRQVAQEPAADLVDYRLALQLFL